MPSRLAIALTAGVDSALEPGARDDLPGGAVDTLSTEAVDGVSAAAYWTGSWGVSASFSPSVSIVKMGWPTLQMSSSA